MKRKINWRTLKFIPVGGDESQAICFKDEGFMHLCSKRRDANGWDGYAIHDTKGMYAKYGNNNIDIDWSDFRPALMKFYRNAPPEKPSMFSGKRYPPQTTIDIRKRLLAAAMREYISPQQLAHDMLEWLSRGREEDTRDFLVTLLHSVGWLQELPQPPAAASPMPLQPSDGVSENQ